VLEQMEDNGKYLWRPLSFNEWDKFTDRWLQFIHFIFHKSINLRCGNSLQFKYNSCKNTTVT
jgi:hypothetical protein